MKLQCIIDTADKHTDKYLALIAFMKQVFPKHYIMIAGIMTEEPKGEDEANFQAFNFHPSEHLEFMLMNIKHWHENFPDMRGQDL